MSVQVLVPAKKVGLKPILAIMTLAISFAIFIGPVSKADADYWCYLGPQATCDSPQNQAGQYNTFTNNTQGRAGCVRVLGYYGEPVSGWACAGEWSIAYIYKPNPDGGWMRSSLKNYNGYYSAWYMGKFGIQ